MVTLHTSEIEKVIAKTSTCRRVLEYTLFSLLIAALALQLMKESIISPASGPSTAPRGTNGTSSEISKNNGMSSFSIPPYTYFILLCLQCGCQPILVKLFMPNTVVRSTCVLAQEGSKLIISLCFLVFSGAWCEATYSWTLTSALLAAGVPGTLFVIQNYCNIMANQFLPPVTFSVLNQTKILSTAWCCFLLMGQKQSPLQFVALIVLVIATLIIQKVIPIVPCQSVTEKQPKEPEDSSNSRERKKDIENLEEIDNEESSPLKANEIEKDASSEEPKAAKAPEDEAARRFTMGVLPALFASFLSGLAGTLSQKTLQLYHRSPHLFNVELSIISSSFLIVTLMLGSPDCQKIKDAGVTQGWTWKTWIPIVTSSLGGILVGLVTKYHGAVFKGFTMIFGMAISGILQQLTFGQMGGGVTKEQFVGACVGALSLWMHASFPAQTS